MRKKCRILLSEGKSPLVQGMTCLGKLWNLHRFEPVSSSVFSGRPLSSVSVALYFWKAICEAFLISIVGGQTRCS